MSQCEICAEVYGYNTPCEHCSIGNPCLDCKDYVMESVSAMVVVVEK